MSTSRARVSAWDSVQPECRLLASDREFLIRRHDAHLEALKTIKPSIDNRTPPKAMGANTVKVALKLEEIERSNHLLHAKLSNMHVAKKTKILHLHEPWLSVSTAASNLNPQAPGRSSEKARVVARENSLMRRRLENVRSGLLAVDQKKDFARHEKYLKQISKVKLPARNIISSSGVSPGSPASIPSLVPLLTRPDLTQASGWSDELWGSSSPDRHAEAN